MVLRVDAGSRVASFIVFRILGITRSFADVLNWFFVYAAVSSPQPRDRLSGLSTSSLITIVGKPRQVPVAARSKALVCGRSLAGVWNCVFESLRMSVS